LRFRVPSHHPDGPRAWKLAPRFQNARKQKRSDDSPGASDPLIDILSRMTMDAEKQKLSAYRYCKWRWLHFRRSWTDTRADRTPSWSRLYARVYMRLLSLVMLAFAAPLVALCGAFGASIVWHALLALPGSVTLAALVVFGMPALATYGWMRPVWLDLVMVRARAIDFSGGRFHTRAREARSVIIGPLARTLNALAERMERLIAAQRELANGISHELRTPLARVRFALENLREPASSIEYENALTSIDQDVTELDELIDMSLTYARLEYSSLQPNLESTQLSVWFADQIDEAALLYTKCEIVAWAEFDRMTQVTMDKRLMSYALRNLLRNASKYARAKIIIGLAVLDGNVELFVEDDGIGIPSAERERIFDAFVRLDRQTGGYGLGLAITHQVLHAHQGRIVVTDPLMLPGARFELSWPAGNA
jgi:two-component system OmpR family sensor kinase